MTFSLITLPSTSPPCLAPRTEFSMQNAQETSTVKFCPPYHHSLLRVYTVRSHHLYLVSSHVCLDVKFVLYWALFGGIISLSVWRFLVLLVGIGSSIEPSHLFSPFVPAICSLIWSQGDIVWLWCYPTGVALWSSHSLPHSPSWRQPAFSCPLGFYVNLGCLRLSQISGGTCKLLKNIVLWVKHFLPSFSSVHLKFSLLCDSRKPLCMIVWPQASAQCPEASGLPASQFLYLSFVHCSIQRHPMPITEVSWWVFRMGSVHSPTLYSPSICAGWSESSPLFTYFSVSLLILR